MNVGFNQIDEKTFRNKKKIKRKTIAQGRRSSGAGDVVAQGPSKSRCIKDADRSLLPRLMACPGHALRGFGLVAEKRKARYLHV